MPMLPGNYGSGENMRLRPERRDTGFKFDFTVNIPTIVTLIVLSIAAFGWVRDRYDSITIIIQQHNILWAEYIKTHEAGK
jgi:hypothetical protein